MPALALALAAVLAGPPAAAAPRPPPPPGDPRAALARAKEATGGDRWDALKAIAVRGKIRFGGLDGEVERLADVRTGRYWVRWTLGPEKGAIGFDGERAWYQDDSGQVRIEGSADARERAANDAYRAARAYWFPERWKAKVEDAGEQRDGDRRFAVVRITPEGGRPFDLWIDAATGLPDRYAELGAERLETTFLSDYREVSGLKIPFSDRARTGDPKYDNVLTVERVTLDPPLEDARFAPPPPPPPDYELAGDATTVPFELLNNHIYVDVRLNGKPFRLLCDTGGSNIVTPALANALGLEAKGALEGRGVGEQSEDVALTRVATLEVGGMTLKGPLFAVFPLASLTAAEGVPANGLIGYEVFKRFVVTIDYAGRKLTLHRPGTFHPPPGAKGVPFRFQDQTPEVDGTLDGIPGTFWLDTGSRADLSLMAPFAEKHGLAKRYGAKVETVTGWGVGGAARGLVARAGRLTLGEGVAIEAPIVSISVMKSGGDTHRYAAGNVGGGILKRFTVTFDYAAQQVWFVPNGTATRKEPYDRSGLWLNLGAGALEVIDVVKGGPGARAGLAPGDRIVAVDGRPATEVGLPAVRTRLRTEPPGTRVRLTVESNGRRREATLVLADLV